MGEEGEYEQVKLLATDQWTILMIEEASLGDHLRMSWQHPEKFKSDQMWEREVQDGSIERATFFHMHTRSKRTHRAHSVRKH